MGLMTAAGYRRSLDDGRQVWVSGKKVERVAEHPAFAPMVSAMAEIYALHHDPAVHEIMTFALPDGGRGSRFYKIPETREDLVRRRQMSSLVLDRVGPTLDRFGDETVSPLFVVQDRADIMDGFDPRYAANARRWLERLQRENLFMTSGNTDPKGDRSKQPFEQADPDLYLRVVEERDEGIVIGGAKFETGAPYAHVAFIKPTVGAWIEENRDYAVACIVPLNAQGVRHICRAPLHAGGAATAAIEDHPLSGRYDEVDTLIVFDRVLVPWDDVIFSRQPKLAQMMRSEFTRWSAQSFLLRSLAKADLLVGTALLVAEQAGTGGLAPVKAKISQLMMHRMAIEAFVLSAESAAETSPGGYVMPNQAIQNAGRVYCSQSHHLMVQLLRDIVGGQAVMLPDAAMLEDPTSRADILKYFDAGAHDALSRLKALNLARELTASSYAGRAQAYQLFAETPVFAQEAALYATFDRDAALERARRLAGLEPDPKDEAAEGEAAEGEAA